MLVKFNRATEDRTRAEQIKPVRQSRRVLILGC